MTIGIISDTHDRLESILKATEIFKENKVEMIIHCGDWVSPFTLEFYDSNSDIKIPINSVFGNNEGDIIRIIQRNNKLRNPIKFTSKQVLELDLDGKKAIVYHGHDKAVLESIIRSQIYDVVFTGHTHAKRNEMIDKTLVLNPGSTCFVRESKIIDQASVAIYDSKTNSAEIIEFTKQDIKE